MTPEAIGAICMFSAYVLGSIPFGLLIARWIAGIDVRDHGSGNIGATNVYRVVGRPAGLAVWVLDVSKGLAPVLVTGQLGLSAWWQVGAGLAAVLGHSFSPFLGFRGGKGVATSAGVLFGLVPVIGLIMFCTWSVVVAITRYVSVATIVATLSLVPLTVWLYPNDTARLVFVVPVTILIVVRHRSNIRRLMTGTENRFGRQPPDVKQDPPAD